VRHITLLGLRKLRFQTKPPSRKEVVDVVGKDGKHDGAEGAGGVSRRGISAQTLAYTAIATLTTTTISNQLDAHYTFQLYHKLM
jgi:hypothetical protein